MRCRYCGKELALLKRLRGGGEFCSEAHRQSFQDEYNQLALSRLMQANPPAPAAPLPEPVNHPGQQVAAQLAAPPVLHTPAALLVAEHRAPKPSVISAEEDSAPVELAAYIFETPDPVMTQTPYVSQIEIGMVAVASPSLPDRDVVVSPYGAHWATNEDVPYAPPIEARDYSAPMSDHPLEAREFGRMATVLELGAGANAENVPDASLEALEVRLASFPPPAPGALWLSPAREFAPLFVELDAFTRLAFTPSGAPASQNVPAAVEILEPVAPQVEESLPIVELAPAAQIETPVAEPEQEAPPVQNEAQVVEAPVPQMVTQPLPVTLHGTAAGRGKVTQVFTSPLTPEGVVQVPPSAALPLRPTMVFGPAPGQKTEARVETKPIGTKPAETKPVEAKPVEAKPVETKTQPKPELKSEPKPELRKETRPPIQVRSKKAVVSTKPNAEPPAAPRTPEIQRVPERQAPVEQVALPTKFDLELPSLNVQTGPWAKLSAGVKIGLAAAIVAAIGGIGYAVIGGGHAKSTSNPAVRQEMTAAPGLPIPDAGWIADWSPDSRGRRISMLRGSMPLTDTRIEFQAQIESKALGWVFRGMNPKNFYVTKLEVIKPGLEPTVALVHFAVIDGREQDRVQVPLPIPVRVDTTYKVRFEAVGKRFTTWVQDQKIDEWNDARIVSGGAGIYAERGESSSLQGVFNVMQLVAKN